MQEIQQDESLNLKKLIRRCLFFSVAMHIVAAWFSTGYHMHDEHFSIFEFAGYKLGITPASALSWEFPAKIRQAFQPALVVGIMKLMGDNANPFFCSFLVRLLAGLLGWASLCMVLFMGLTWLNTASAKKLFILCTCLLWFFPCLHVRFSAESLSGSFFFIGMALIWNGRERVKNFLLALGGFSVGLAFVCRYQTGFMVFGLVVWCILVSRFSIYKFMVTWLPALLAIGIGIVLDHWFYGEWLSTAWNYYKINLMEGRAAEFGVSPWWSYFGWVGLDMIPPFSILCIAAIIYTFYKHPRNIVTMSVLPFLVVHILIGHKEERFLFPLINGIPILLAMAYDRFQLKITRWKRLQGILVNIFLGLNIILLLISSFKPASDQFGLYEYIYTHYNGKSANLLSKGNQPYHLVDFNLYFHKPADIHLMENVKNEQADSFASHANGPVLLLFTKQADADIFMKIHPHQKPVYSNIPTWLYAFNFNDWVSRTRVWVLFELKK